MIQVVNTSQTDVQMRTSNRVELTDFNSNPHSNPLSVFSRSEANASRTVTSPRQGTAATAALTRKQKRACVS